MGQSGHEAHGGFPVPLESEERPRLLTVSLRLTEPGMDGFLSWEKRLEDQKPSGRLGQALPAPEIVTGRDGHPQNGWEKTRP